MANYDSKHELNRSRLLKVQEIAIPLFITANVTPGSKTLANDEPALLFIKSQGLDQITLANGAVDTAGELSAITFASVTDATGIFSVLLRINEQIEKVVSAQMIQRSGTEVINATFPTGATTGISSAGDKIVLNFDSGVNFTNANYDASLIVRYVVSQ